MHPLNLRRIAVWALVLLCAGPVLAGPAKLGVNLIRDGGAESAAGTDGYTVVAIPKWKTKGSLTAVLWGASGFPTADDAGPKKRGLNFFAGGPDNPKSSVTQRINLSALASDIDSGSVGFELLGYLGGFSDQNDHATLSATFLDAAGQSLGSSELPAVLAADRGGVSGMLKRSAQGPVPVGTRAAMIVLTMTRTDGSYNDGYADGLSLVLSTAP